MLTPQAIFAWLNFLVKQFLHFLTISTFWINASHIQFSAEAYLEASQTSTMELSCKIS